MVQGNIRLALALARACMAVVVVVVVVVVVPRESRSMQAPAVVPVAAREAATPVR